MDVIARDYYRKVQIVDTGGDSTLKVYLNCSQVGGPLRPEYTTALRELGWLGPDDLVTVRAESRIVTPSEHVNGELTVREITNGISHTLLRIGNGSGDTARSSVQFASVTAGGHVIHDARLEDLECGNAPPATQVRSNWLYDFATNWAGTIVTSFALVGALFMLVLFILVNGRSERGTRSAARLIVSSLTFVALVGGVAQWLGLDWLRVAAAAVGVAALLACVGRLVRDDVRRLSGRSARADRPSQRGSWSTTSADSREWRRQREGVGRTRGASEREDTGGS